MPSTKSRMYKMSGIAYKNDDGTLKEGDEYTLLNNAFGHSKIGVITRWKMGMLHSEGGEPAVQFEDTHTEYYRNGVLHNDLKDSFGRRMPAVIAEYQTVEEYWENGKQIPPPSI